MGREYPTRAPASTSSATGPDGTLGPHPEPGVDLRFAYHPEQKAFGYRGWDAGPTGPLPARTLHGCPGTPTVEVWAFPDRVALALHHRFEPGGGMDVTEAHGQRWAFASERLRWSPPPLSEAACAALRAHYAEPRWWDAEAWTAQALAVFRRRTARGDDVPAGEADGYELAASETHPALTLRLGRARDELVLDHGRAAPSRERRTEPRPLPGPEPGPGPGWISEAFGAEVARVAQAFGEDRGRWFVPSARAAVVAAAERLNGSLCPDHGDVAVWVRDERGAEVVVHPHAPGADAAGALADVARTAPPALAAEALAAAAHRHRASDARPDLRAVGVAEGRAALLGWLGSTQRRFDGAAVDALFAAFAPLRPACFVATPRRREGGVQVALVGPFQALLVDGEGDGP